MASTHTIDSTNLHASVNSLLELQLYSPDEEHLYWLQFMGALRRLDVWCPVGGPLDELQVVVPPPARPSTVQWMRLCGPPRATIESLLRAFAPSLETLWLFVGTNGEGSWPWACPDLGPMLRACGLASIRKVVLQRPLDHEYYPDEVGRCSWQKGAVSRALPGVEVKCNFCDKVPMEDF